VLLAGELVTNAVVHARNDLRLRLELRGELLHLAVRDDSRRPLRPVTVPDPEAEGGRGLWLVEHFARAWGSTATPTAARSSGAPSPSNHWLAYPCITRAGDGACGRSHSEARVGCMVWSTTVSSSSCRASRSTWSRRRVANPSTVRAAS
jgi:hypothetical protein